MTIPAELQDAELQQAMRKLLAPPPVASGNQILAESGGMYYSREAPEREPFVAVGDHFDEGDPLYVIEVMKMFNVVRASFSGTVDELLVANDGTVVKKGQPLFVITPDEALTGESAQAREARRAQKTRALVESLLGQPA